jgi:hypothetical protein
MINYSIQKKSQIILTDIKRNSRERERVNSLITETEFKIKDSIIKIEVLNNEIDFFKKSEKESDEVNKIIKLKSIQRDTIKNSVLPQLQTLLGNLDSQRSDLEKLNKKLVQSYEYEVKLEENYTERESLTIVSFYDFSEVLPLNRIMFPKGSTVEIIYVNGYTFIKVSDDFTISDLNYTPSKVDYTKIRLSERGMMVDEEVKVITESKNKFPIEVIKESSYIKYTPNFDYTVTINPSQSILLIDDEFNIGENSLWSLTTLG